MTRSDPIPALHAVAEALAAQGQPSTAFMALERATMAAIGHRLFTIMRHDPVAGRNRRAYSSDPVAYPVSGYKAVNWDHPWTRRVLVDGRAWIGRDAAEIAWAYPDYEKIVGMGLASAMNLPVRWGGRTLGTVNLLHDAAHFTEADAAAGALFAALAVPALLAVDAG
jgi:hypothetical protein